jgi:hypothetical protein
MARGPFRPGRETAPSSIRLGKGEAIARASRTQKPKKTHPQRAGLGEAFADQDYHITPIKIQVGKGDYTGDLGAQFKELAKDFDWFCSQLGEGMAPVLALALKPTLELSAEYCPKDTGTLVASRYLEVEAFRGQSRVEIGYARGGEPHYAIVVHEDPSKTHAPPTRYKFLEVAINEDWGNVTQRLAAGAKVLAGGGS